ncbi:sensor histidine kinase [uncultured Amnibacterium sp.]|uniref:sensor histidine kinase n=1 Tax=uncultured Amnibacterium sp. TaxID=1631851 RepID=UPI0035CB396D
MTGTAAHDRVLRVTATLFGVGAVVFGLLDLPAIGSQLHVTPPGWTVPALLATLALPLALGVAAPFAPVGVLRGLAIAVGAANLLALATVAPVSIPALTAAQSPWVLQLTAVGTTALALAAPVRWIAADVVLTTVLVAVDRLGTARADLALIAAQDALYSLLFCSVFAALAVGALRAGRSVDLAAAEAFHAVTAAHDERVRTDERLRVHGLVHDHVLTTLLVAGRSPEPSEVVAADAADALARLERLLQPDAQQRAATPGELLDRLRALTTATAPDAALVVEGASGPEAIPAAVVEVLVGAAGEGLRNSRRHAGAAATIEVRVLLVREHVEILVIDDGAGFAREAVPADRLGIAASIEARLRSVDGTAEVRSQPGRGTAVRIRWPV